MQLKTFVANADGRTEAPLLEDNEMVADTWQIVFHVGEYFRGLGHPDAGRFLNDVPVVFVIDPAMPKDIETMTLSYTFFEVEGNRHAATPAKQGGA